MNAAFRAAGIADVGDYHADASRDIELGQIYRNKEHNASRASLPYSHRRSHSIASRPPEAAVYSNTNGEETLYGGDDEEEEHSEDVKWGPLHPCFPHINPHVPVASIVYDRTRIIRVRRDYLMSKDLVYGFSRTFPETLEPVLSEAVFREVIDHVNTVLYKALNPFDTRNIVDRIVSYCTANLYDDLGLTSTKRDLAKLEAWIANWNRTVGRKEGVKVISPRRTGYLNLDFQIPDPRIATEPNERADVLSLVNSQSRKLAGRPTSTYSGTDGGSLAPYPVPPIPGKWKGEQAQPSAWEEKQ